MINFEHTSELNGIIEFVNHRGETVRTYSLAELEEFVINKGLHIKFENVDAIGSSWGGNPNYVQQEVETTMPVSIWLDDQNNFVEACKAFYKSKNPHEFKSFNREQETIRRVG